MTNPPPPAPEPDVKDWTWVIREPCPNCGYDARQVTNEDVPERTDRYAATIAAALDGPSATARPEPNVWSPLEYACHVRDVCTLFAQRLDLMLTEDDPQFANWDQDVTAVEERYWEQQPGVVANELRVAAAGTAAAFAAVDDNQWQRPAQRSDGAVFTVDTFARYFLHDLAHHAWDITGQRW
ncbi:MAG TPA: DinB family protein [Jatrophihabitans sp.]|nr:DinB family protein [Jatrophihabitans sp.]